MANFTAGNNSPWNLQATMAGSTHSRSVVAPLIARMWSDFVLRDFNIVSDDLRQFITLSNHGGGAEGDIVNVRVMGRLGATRKTPGIPVVMQTAPVSSFPINLDRHIESSFSIEDISKMLTPDGLLEEHLTMSAKDALYRHMMGTILGMRAHTNHNPANRIWATTDGTATGESRPLDLNHILRARTELMSRNCDPKDIVLVVSAQQLAQLLANQRVQNFFFKGGMEGQAISDGVVGSLFGIQVRVSNFLTANSTTGWFNGNLPQPQTPGVAGSAFQPTQESFTELPLTWGTPQATPGGNEVHTAYMFHKEHIVMATPFEPTTAAEYSVPYLMWIFVTSVLYGVRAYRQNTGFVIHTNGSVPSLTNQF